MVYYFFISIWVAITQIASKSLFRTKWSAHFIFLVIFIVFLCAVNMVPINADMDVYLRNLSQSHNQTLGEALQLEWGPGFVVYQWLLSKVTISKTVFITLTASIIWGTLFYALRKIVLIKDLPILIFGYFSFFYLYNFSTNTLRQGIAASLIVLLIVFLWQSKYKKALFAFGAACCFHISGIISVFLFIIKRLNISLKLMSVLYLISSFLMLSGLNSFLIPDLSHMLGGEFQSKVEDYTATNVIEHYGGGNRLDFFVFTTFWAVWSIVFARKYYKNDAFFVWVIKSYLLLSSVYLLFGFIAYSDRIAAYAWFLIPILIFYPIINLKGKTKPLWVMISIIITMLMFFYFNGLTILSPLKLFY